MKHLTFIALVIAGASVIGAGTAMAKSPGQHGPRMNFEEMDANADGEVSKAEMEAVRARHFTEADTNGDGALSLEEMTARASKRADVRAERMLKEHDANGDGALSAEELPKPRGMEKRFSRLDTDESGGISKEEFDAARKAHRGGKGRKQWKEEQQDQN